MFLSQMQKQELMLVTLAKKYELEQKNRAAAKEHLLKIQLLLAKKTK